jgi:hypothetical protein
VTKVRRHDRARTIALVVVGLVVLVVTFVLLMAVLDTHR